MKFSLFSLFEDIKKRISEDLSSFLLTELRSAPLTEVKKTNYMLRITLLYVCHNIKMQPILKMQVKFILVLSENKNKQNKARETHPSVMLGCHLAPL